jgi:hypothetical protein
MIRSSEWDAIPIITERLKLRFSEHKAAINDLVEKANVEDQQALEHCTNLFTDVNDLCKSLYQSFCSLRADYNTGKINLARYRGHLQPIKSLLVERDEPIKNENLHLEDIVEELQKHF